MTDHTPIAHHPDRPANRLARETSPYLLQHRHNPVDWYPWGAAALDRARAEDKPIFLSVGYSACHWCHVMERESFENDAIAALLNQHFVNIKVDREERPEIDAIYMSAVQAMTGRGGWPMSVWLTPDGEPFFGGTYYPPADSRGMPGFPRVIEAVARAWVERRDELTESARELTARLKSLGELPAGQGNLTLDLLEHASKSLLAAFDPRHGGFGDAPKFPHPMDLQVLLRRHARAGDAASLHAVRLTLDKMARGGIRDHLGGGFARYSTDAYWLVPHFEKMLYDNALLAQTYLEAYQTTGAAADLDVAASTLDYLLSRMTSPDGPFYSAEDADSEGVEGKFYVWSRTEILDILGPDRGRVFCDAYDVTNEGNWEHSNILNLPRPLDVSAKLLGRDVDSLRADLADDARTLFLAREKRIPPAKDTKTLASWNGLAIAACARAAAPAHRPDFLAAAARAADFILDHMRTPAGLLLHSHKDGQAKFNGCLDDYANLIDGLTRLFEATGDDRRLVAAVTLAEVMLDEFADLEIGGFFQTGRSHEALVARPKDVYDNATPSGNGMAAAALLRLAALTGRDDFAAAGRRALESVQVLFENAPGAAGQSLIALDHLLGPNHEIVVVEGDSRDEFEAALAALGSRFLPRAVVVPAPAQPPRATSTLVPLLDGRNAVSGRLTTYICSQNTCLEPAVGLEATQAALDKLAAHPS